MKNLKILFKILVFCIIGAILFLLITPIFIPKTINENLGLYRATLQGFYTEPKNSLDVVFIGDSSIYRGISPIKMWQEYGFTSYDYASPSQRMWDNYYSIEEVLKYQKPKVIVLNIDQAFTEKPMGKAKKRHMFDNMPNSITRTKAVINKVQKNGIKEALTLMFPLFRFHSRWSELTDDDFIYAYNNFHYFSKGYQLTAKSKKYSGDKDYMKKENNKSKIGKNAEEYLNKIKEICDKNSIDLLLIEIPSPNTWNKTKNKKVNDWASKNNVKFLDLNLYLNEMKINWEKDTQDEGYHMNVWGAEKISMYLGEYLKNEYKLEDHRKDKNYEQWNKDASEYEKQKTELENM